MTTEQAIWTRDLYLKSLELESKTTEHVLAAVPVEAAEYKPDGHSRTAMELLRHIAVADNRFVEAVVNGEFNLQNTLPETVRTPTDVAEWYAARHAANRTALANLPAEALLKPVDFRGKFTWPAVMFLQLGLHHAIHHRGQLSAYLRAMGSKVPSIYGESYDATQARLAAAR
jgi:uncharacterized damage-inducible protein DinB